MAEQDNDDEQVLLTEIDLKPVGSHRHDLKTLDLNEQPSNSDFDKKPPSFENLPPIKNQNEDEDMQSNDLNGKPHSFENLNSVESGEKGSSSENLKSSENTPGSEDLKSDMSGEKDPNSEYLKQGESDGKGLGSEESLLGEKDNLNQQVSLIQVLSLTDDKPVEEDVTYIEPVPDPYGKAIKYLEKHSILQLFQQLTTSIVFHRPQNPIDYMMGEVEEMIRNRDPPKETT